MSGEVDCQRQIRHNFSRSNLNYVHLNIFNDASSEIGRKKKAIFNWSLKSKYSDFGNFQKFASSLHRLSRFSKWTRPPTLTSIKLQWLHQTNEIVLLTFSAKFHWRLTSLFWSGHMIKNLILLDSTVFVVVAIHRFYILAAIPEAFVHRCSIGGLWRCLKCIINRHT